MSATPINITATVKTLNGRGRDFTRARNVVIARALATGTKAAVIVSESGVDKGDVSRIGKRLGELKEARANTKEGKAYKFILSLDVASINADVWDTVAPVAAVGVFFERVKVATGAAQGKGQGKQTADDAPATVNPVTGSSDSTDMQAVIFDFVAQSSDPEATAALIAEWVALALDHVAVAQAA